MRLSLDGVGHRFEPAPYLFQELQLDANPGDMVALVGPSGSGKSTLLGICAGWIKPTQGRVDRHGIASVSWVPQNPMGVARRSALDHVSLPLITGGISRRQAECTARTLLDRFALGGLENRRFQELSGGEAQRLLLARSLARASDLVLVDEPTAQLDRVNAEAVAAVLGQVINGDRIVVVATHDERVVGRCTKVVDLLTQSVG